MHSGSFAKWILVRQFSDNFGGFLAVKHYGSLIAGLGL